MEDLGKSFSKRFAIQIPEQDRLTSRFSYAEKQLMSFATCSEFSSEILPGAIPCPVGPGNCHLRRPMRSWVQTLLSLQLEMC